MISIKSKIIIPVLNFYFLHPEHSFYVNEIARRFNIDKRNLVKKLKELEKEGLFVSKVSGNQRYYSLNKKYPLYKEYRNIFMKTAGIEEKLKSALSNVERIKEAYIYGSYTRGNMDAFSDIDLIIIGSHDTIMIQKEISRLQKDIDREINVINIDLKEFDDKKKRRDPFILDIFKNKHIKII
ncbi:MAG: nucleotidyltransferase domain-containing protein [Candidatus Omnitrophota bacterium]|nr:nucleotidyltransferase domain-containing protein [Candidatus Omnitrophota bacterium]